MSQPPEILSAYDELMSLSARDKSDEDVAKRFSLSERITAWLKCATDKERAAYYAGVEQRVCR